MKSQKNNLKFRFLIFSHCWWVKHNPEGCPRPKLVMLLPPVGGYKGGKNSKIYIGPQEAATSPILVLCNPLGCVWPTSNEKRSKFETLNGLFTTSFFLFLPISAPKLALAGRPMGLAELFWAGGWSDHPSASLHSKIFEKSKIDVTNWYLYSGTLC